MKKLAARKVSIAMYTHVTHPNARRVRGCRPPRSSVARPFWLSGLEDTGLRGPSGAEVVQEHRGYVRDPARRGLPAETAGQHEDVGVLGVARAVDGRHQASPGDLAERAPR